MLSPIQQTDWPKSTLFPTVFADASQCSDLIAWSTLQQIKVTDGATEYTIGDLYDVGRMKRPDLVVLSTNLTDS